MYQRTSAHVPEVVVLTRASPRGFGLPRRGLADFLPPRPQCHRCSFSGSGSLLHPSPQLPQRRRARDGPTERQEAEGPIQSSSSSSFGLTSSRSRSCSDAVDGQHPNFIDGVWHCLNCSCPENIAIGRRKGPLGDKSQCGECCGSLPSRPLPLLTFCLGTYWHRHRRPRPVKYSTDPKLHLWQQTKGGNDEGNLKAVNSKKQKPQPIVDEVKYEEADAPEDPRDEEDEVALTAAANVAKLKAQTASVLPRDRGSIPSHSICCRSGLVLT